MSGGSIGTIAGGIIGAIIGSIVPGVGTAMGFYLGATIGGIAGNLIDPPDSPNSTGPRLSDLGVQTSTYGAYIPRVYGTIALFGNLFWLENNQLKEVANEEGGGKGGGLFGGGASVTTYSYFATFALGLCEGPIVGIRRIWVGPKLIYDSGTSDRAGIIASNQNAQYFTVYTGADDQDPDPRMEATLGVGQVPAYRGLAYLLVEDFPLEDYGNSLVVAQWKVEVVKDATSTYLFEPVTEIPVSGNSGTKHMVQANDLLYISDYLNDVINVVSIADPENPILISEVSCNSPFTMAIDYENNMLWVTEYDSAKGDVFDITSGIPLLLNRFNTANSNDKYVSVENGIAYITNVITDPLQHFYYDYETGTAQFIDGTNIHADPLGIVVHNGIAYIAGGFYTYDVSDPFNPVELDNLSGAGLTANTWRVWCDFDRSLAYVSSSSSSAINIIDISDPSNLALLDTLSSPGGTGTRQCVAFTGNYLFIGNNDQELSVYDATDPSNATLIGTLPTDSNPSTIITDGYYLYVSNREDDTLQVFFFADGIITPGTIPLSEIVESEALKSNLIDASDIDVTSLTPIVRGYRVNDLAPIRASIDPLRISWPFDVRMHGYVIEFLLRGSDTSLDTITEDELDARKSGDNPGVSVTNSREMDTQLPVKVSIKHFDVNREYDVGEQYFERLNTDSANNISFDLPISLTSDEAAQKAEQLLYTLWMERYDIQFNLPPTYLHLEPADIVTLTTSDSTYQLRINSLNYNDNNTIEVKAKYNVAAVYSPVASGEEGLSTGVELIRKGPALPVMLDIPMLQEAYDTPGYMTAMAGYSNDWPGGVLFKSVNEGESWASIQGFSSPGSTIGYALTYLSTHDGCTLDKSSTLSARLTAGSLSSVTESDMFNGYNWFAYGSDGRWEIIAAQNCALQGDGTYTLTDFLRGQFGTEWATSQHAAYDYIVKLSTDDLAFVRTADTEIGVSYDFKGVTIGTALQDASSFSFSYDAVNLECLSPCHLTGSRHPTSNDWTITWTRRTRYAGWRDLIDARLGETSESYEVDIFTSGTYATLKRTISGLSSASATYSSANQVTDFGGNQSTIYIAVYQLSSTAGRGYPAYATLTRT